jgi:hypothetical protein
LRLRVDGFSPISHSRMLIEEIRHCYVQNRQVFLYTQHKSSLLKVNEFNFYYFILTFSVELTTFLNPRLG